MKIVRIFSRLNVGGPTIHVVELSKGLKNFGHETTLVVGEVSPTEGDMSYYALKKGITPKKIKGFSAPISPLRDFVSFFKILITLIRIKPDIVHTHTFKAGLLGRVAAFICRTPIVVHTYHGHVFSGYFGRRATSFIIWLETKLSLVTSKVITVSENVNRDIVELGIAPAHKVSTIPLGFDLDDFEVEMLKSSHLRQSLGIADDVFLLGFIGRFVPIKNLDLLLETMQELSKKGKKIQLILVGDGPDRERVQRQYPNPCCHYVGWQKNIIRNLKDIDLLLCTSKNEGTSVSVIEAMLAGVKVLSTPVGGMVDLAKQCEALTLIDATPSAFAKAILSEYATFKRHTRVKDTKTWALFSKERLCQDISSLYSGLEPEKLKKAKAPSKSL